MMLTTVGVAVAGLVLAAGTPAVELEPSVPFVVRLVNPDQSVATVCAPDMPCAPGEHLIGEISMVGDVLVISGASLSQPLRLTDDWTTVVVEAVAPYSVVAVPVVIESQDGSRLILESWQQPAVGPDETRPAPVLPSATDVVEQPATLTDGDEGVPRGADPASPVGTHPAAAVFVAKSVLSFGTIASGSKTVDLGDLRYATDDSASGWTVSVVATDLTDGINRIPASALTLDPGPDLRCSQGVIAESVRRPLRFSGAGGAFSAPATLASGNSTAGECSHRGGTARLTLPAGTPAGTYRGTIQYTILN